MHRIPTLPLMLLVVLAAGCSPAAQTSVNPVAGTDLEVDCSGTARQ